MRSIGVLFVISLIVCGCATNPTVPSVNDAADIPDLQLSNTNSKTDNHRLWGEWKILIDADHTHVEAIPIRSGRFHLNTLKFLEETCTDCLQITGIHNNGDNTIDMMVRITHPFPGHPEYTGFDVKGIIMFEGSHEIPDNVAKYPLYPQNYWLSWRLMGDPELMNADGFTYLWSPWYDSGKTQPIFNYREGRFTSGVPTANVNGYLNFYSRQDRHIFDHDASVTRVYTIWLPPGPVTAGYAIDACWVPPVNTPVTNPVVDFPLSANQPEAYRFKCVINNGEPITVDDPCCRGDDGISRARAEIYTWYVPDDGWPTYRWVGIWNEKINYQKVGFCAPSCDGPPEWRCLGYYPFDVHKDGVYQLVGIEYHASDPPPIYLVYYPAFDVFEIEIDME